MYKKYDLFVCAVNMLSLVSPDRYQKREKAGYQNMILRQSNQVS